MIFMVIFLAIAVYIAIAVAFVLYVRRRTKKKSHLWLAIAFVILLPTWDVVLGYIVYYPACLLVPKVAIYETALTDGIYYEGMNDYLRQQQLQRRNGDEFKLVGIGWIAQGIEKGFLFIEYKSEGRPDIYECTKLEKNNPINENAKAICKVRNAIKSKYEVRVSTIPVGITEINFKKIFDRSTGKLMAEYKQATRWAAAGSYGIPFFNWLGLGDGSKAIGSEHCPANNMDYEYFEYKILKPTK